MNAPSEQRTFGFPRAIDPAVLAILRCPDTRSPLIEREVEGRRVLAIPDSGRVYAFRAGVPVLLPGSGTPPN